jgi:hypothetical protein
VHRVSVTEELLKYPGFTVPHYNMYEWNSFSDGWKKNKKDMILAEMKFA